jgi:hypothetical protein
MHTSALEEAALTEDTNEQERQSEASETISSPEPETQTQATMALVPTEPDVIEGEVIEVPPLDESEDRIPLKQKPYWLLIPFTILVCLSILAASLVLPLISPSATVIIIPVSRDLTTTATLYVPARALPALTLSQHTTVAATGKGHQDASKATGTVTFYNGLLSEQTIAAGTILTGADGVPIITTEAALIPPARNTTPPTFGRTTVLAHALNAGEQGNIPSYDINGSCCTPSVLVKNTAAFTGGQNERDFSVVSRAEIATTAATLKASLTKSEQAALQAQLNPGEGLITPLCSQQIQSDHKAGEEAKEVTVTVAETCSAIVYDTQALHQKATQMLTQETVKRFGTGYRLLGDIAIQVVHATITDHTRGIATLSLKLDATYIYQIREGVKEKLIKLLAGKPTQQAIDTLLQFPGIKAASIQLAGGNTTLPADPNHIHIIVMYQTS